MTRAAALAPVLIAIAGGCSHGDVPAGSDAAGGDAARASGPSLEASVSPGALDEGGAEGGIGAATWTGTYKTVAGTLYVPEDWKVRWRPEDATSGVGEGPLTLSVDPVRGVVQGSLDGPIGPAVVDGYLADGGLSAKIGRRDPHDHGFAGVLTGKATGGKMEGTLNVSPATGGAVRVGTFSVAPGGAVTGP
jgi:hypothetical protein